MCVVDFEKGLVNVVKYEFNATQIVGCYFHFQQALFRKMRKLGIDQGEASIGCSLLRKITKVDQKNIQTELEDIKGNDCLVSLSWPRFWIYFEKTWIIRYPPDLWNINNGTDVEIEARTNNGLERYNRRLGDKFMNAHPNIFAFVGVIQEEEAYFSNLCRGIRSGAIPFPHSKSIFDLQ
jgi:hypothetical protein